MTTKLTPQQKADKAANKLMNPPKKPGDTTVWTCKPLSELRSAREQTSLREARIGYLADGRVWYMSYDGIHVGASEARYLLPSEREELKTRYPQKEGSN